MSQFDYIQRNFDHLTAEIRAMNPNVTLVCVTKSGSDEELLALAAAGAADIAENRPQELVRRCALLRAAGFSPRMHEIGNLQTNKVKSILPICHLIHSVGSEHLALEIEKQAAALGQTVPVLMEINSADEDAKGGVLPKDAFGVFEKIKALPHLSLRGIMTMGPVLDDPEDYLPYFRMTRQIYEKIGETSGYDTDSPILSMGMSHSYRQAIREGATLVRVGRHLFEK